MLGLLDKIPMSETPLRRPRIDQLNFDRDLPEPLSKLAKAEGIELQSHSDNRGRYTELCYMYKLISFGSTIRGD